ncbi:hypothetical protein [Anoxynatronum buryatiense]|uniref:Nicotianamine synthase n=1 Tax=Anoxynatronum buryatiense TaxID=489973 RepID=A0AA45WX73_9CLOT|nr:hypothetical protein [Anoxynatronum buryatiense]SMP62931.1 hypothetical protein SAMN06296020_110127 [Anoxynatronum buryatiense]
MIPALTRFTEKSLSHFPASYPLMRLYYRSIVNREIGLGSINRHDRVLCVGGGAFPVTAMEICRHTGAAVDVLDCDLDAVEHARDLLRKMGMWQIFVHHGCGQSFDPSVYNVVHLALQVRGREQILENLQQYAQPGTRILVRLPHSKLERFYEAPCQQTKARLAQQAQLRLQPGSTMAGTCMLVKEDTAHEAKSLDIRSWTGAPAVASLAD